LPTRGKETTDLDEHLNAMAVEEFRVTGHLSIVPDAIGDAGARLELEAGVLPKVAVFGAV
jgi:hypothetical protein